MEIPVELARILITETADQQIIVLRETDGDRSFPIVIGFFEATAIDRGVKRIRTPRPMTHDLAASTIEKMGGRLQKIVVTSLVDHTFFAKLVIEVNGEIIEVDSRPSDAIAIAVTQELPIFVDEEVLGQVCAGPPDE